MADTLANMLARNRYCTYQGSETQVRKVYEDSCSHPFSELAKSYQAPPPLKVVADSFKAGSGIIVLSCSDPRLNPYNIFGVDASIKATMIRNAGGRALDALRTISVLQTIGGAKMVAVLHHTDCGLTHVSDEDVKQRLLKLAPGERNAIENLKFGEIRGSIEESLKEDVAFLAASPFVSPGTHILGLKFDIDSGLVTEIGREINRT